MHRRPLAALMLALALALGPSPSHAAVSAADLITAALEQDLQGASSLLLAEGLDQAALEQVTRGEPITIAATDLGSGYMLVTLEDFVGQSLWCFLAVDESGQTRLLAWEIMGDYATVHQAPVWFEGQGLLVPVHSTWARGSGALLNGVVWYLLTDSGLNKVLDYPVLGDVSGWGLPYNRSFGVTTLTAGQWDGAFVIKTRLDACYSNALEDDPGFGLNVLCYTAQVNYVFDAGAGAFVVDPATSEMTREQVDALFNENSDEFLAHNVERFKELIPTADDMTLGWLRRFLALCSDSPHRTALESMLQ